MESSCMHISPTCSWCALGTFGFKVTCFLKQKLVKCPYLWQVLHWYFLAGHLKPSTCLESPHLEHLCLLVWDCLGSNSLLYGGACCSLVGLLEVCGHSLKAFLLCLPGGRSVHWCLIRLIWTTCRSLTTCLMCLTVALDASIFLASCLALLVGNLSRSILLSLMVLDTNSSSFRRNQKRSLCKIFAVSCGYLERHTWAYTTLYHSSTNLLPWWKLASRSNLAYTSLVWGLQKSSYLDQIVSKLSSAVGKHQETYWIIPKSTLHAITFLHFFDSGSIASSQSKMFLHLSFHFKNLWYKPSLTVQSILGPSMYGMYMVGTNCTWLVDGWWSSTCISVCWVELVSFSNQAEFLVVLDILGL